MIRMQNHVPGQTHFGFVFQPLSIFPVISLIMVIDDGIVTTLDLYTSSANSLSHLSTKKENQKFEKQLQLILEIF